MGSDETATTRHERAGRPGQTASQRIVEEATSWPGVTAAPGRRGELAFKVGRREIGHLHGDRAAHFGFPKNVGAELRDQGRVGPHPVDPASPGFAARRLDDETDIQEVIALLRLNYDRVVAKDADRNSRSHAASEAADGLNR